jgi:hypothetical protein
MHQHVAQTAVLHGKDLVDLVLAVEPLQITLVVTIAIANLARCIV